MVKQEKLLEMMRTNKMAFDYNFTMMLTTYEQNKLLMHTLLAQSTDVSPEVKEAMDAWLLAYRKGCEDFKKMVDEGYETVEKTLAASRK